jgi:uncharacterized membrane protein YqjE
MLKDTILKFLKLDGLVNNLTGYIETRIELMKYEVKEDIARAVSKMAMFLLLGLLFTFFLLFISVAIATKIGESIGNFAGFGIVASFYLVMLLLAFILRESISKAVEKKLKDIIKHKRYGTDGNR